jgi:hypothetical protein
MSKAGSRAIKFLSHPSAAITVTTAAHYLLPPAQIQLTQRAIHSFTTAASFPSCFYFGCQCRSCFNYCCGGKLKVYWYFSCAAALLPYCRGLPLHQHQIHGLALIYSMILCSNMTWSDTLHFTLQQHSSLSQDLAYACCDPNVTWPAGVLCIHSRSDNSSISWRARLILRHGMACTVLFISKCSVLYT